MEQNITQTVSENVLVKKLGVILSAFVFLLPIFFVPNEIVNLYVAKITLFATGLVIIFAVFLSSVLSKGIIEMPKAKYLLPIFLFGVISVISSIFSDSIENSISGNFFDLGTAGSILMLVFSLFVTIVSIRSINVVDKIMSWFLYSSMVLSLYTIVVNLFGASFPKFLISKIPQFLPGGVIDVAIILGASVIVSLGALNMKDLPKKIHYSIVGLIVVSLVFIGAASFLPIIVLLGISALMFFVYLLSWNLSGNALESGQSNRKISISALSVLMVMTIFVLGGSGIGSYLSEKLKIQVAEIRPNFQTTMNLTVKAWQKNVAFGIGPNRFANFWSQNKPIDVNQSQFWSSEFYSGSGFIPTVAITTGLVGLLSLLFFIAMYLLYGVKAIFAQAGNGYHRYLATSSFLTSLYLWLVMFFYTPSITVVALAFIFTGIFTATLVPQGIIGVWRVNIFSNPKANFLSVLGIVILLVLSVVGGYFVWEKSIASVIFQKGVLSYRNNGDLSLARELIVKSTNIAQKDIYWRGLAEVTLEDLTKELNNVANKNQISDDMRLKIQNLIGGVIESAKNAVNADSGNFQNWFALARIYEILAQNGISGSIESAKSSYVEASLRSPNNPATPLSLARLNILENDFDLAEENINKSLSLKNNYSDAYFTLAQIQVVQKDIDSAIKSVEALTVIEPNNPGLYFQLGLLKYNQKDFLGAAGAFERSITLAPDYANAKYFLGITYYQINRKDDAIRLFTELNQMNYEIGRRDDAFGLLTNNKEVNKEVSDLLEIMKSGKPLFEENKKSMKPENRVEPPIRD